MIFKHFRYLAVVLAFSTANAGASSRTDEALLGAFDAYRAGRGGDAAFYLSAHGARQHTNSQARFNHAALSVVAGNLHTATPGTFQLAGGT